MASGLLFQSRGGSKAAMSLHTPGAVDPGPHGSTYE
jgi:hypothetical protein